MTAPRKPKLVSLDGQPGHGPHDYAVLIYVPGQGWDHAGEVARSGSLPSMIKWYAWTADSTALGFHRTRREAVAAVVLRHRP